MHTNIISNFPSIIFVHSTRNLMGQLANHVVRNLNIISGYIQTNVYSLAISSLGINLSLLYLSSKIIDTASPYFNSELFKKKWIQQISPIIFKTVFLSSGLALASQILDLKLTKAYVLINAVAVVISFQLLGKEILKKDQENVTNKIDESSDEESISNENKPPKLDLNKANSGEDEIESTPTTPTPPTGKRNKELLKTTILESKNKEMEDAGY